MNPRPAWAVLSPSHKTPSTKQYINVSIKSMILLSLFCVFSCYQCLSVKVYKDARYAWGTPPHRYGHSQWNALLYSDCSQPHTAVLEVCFFTHLAGYPHKYKLPGVGVLSQGDAFTKYSQNALWKSCAGWRYGISKFFFFFLVCVYFWDRTLLLCSSGWPVICTNFICLRVNIRICTNTVFGIIFWITWEWPIFILHALVLGRYLSTNVMRLF